MDNNSSVGGKAFTGIGNFAGRLEGNHKKICGLKIIKTITDNVGLISILGDGGYICNLTIAKGGSIKGTNWVGACVGKVAKDAEVTIKGVTNHATVEGTNFVGGLVGASAGKLTTSNSSNSGNVNGENSVGGIVGGNYSNNYLANVYSYAKSITSENGGQLGGIVGHHNKDTGAAGPTFKVQSVYWLYDATVGTVSITGGGVITGTGHGFSKLMLAKFANATVTNFLGWDFEKVWEILEGAEYPTLRKPVVTP